MRKVRTMFSVPDLRNKILFTIFIMALYRFGSYLTVPGVRFEAIEQLTKNDGNSGVLGFVSLFSGGALTRLAIFGLGIIPYITSSIIVQLMQVVIPKLAQWREEGPTGQKKITQATRYLTIVLALMQSIGFAYAMNSSEARQTFGLPSDVEIFHNFGPGTVLLFTLTMVTGTALLMWMGELITQKGIGQGMSILIFTSIVSRLPVEVRAIYEQTHAGKGMIVLAFVVMIIIGVVIVEQAQRRIPVQYAKRVVGNKMYAGQSTYIPLKINPSGVIPIIFASSLLQFPAIIATVVAWEPLRNFITNDIFNQNSTSPLHYLLYGGLIVGFAYFYNQIQFDPYQQAEDLKKQGGYVPGVRPGAETESHFRYVLNRITLPGALFLAFIALLPAFVLAVFGVSNFPLAGTTLLIAVGVSLETMKQIDSQLLMRNYEGFLSK